MARRLGGGFASCWNTVALQWWSPNCTLGASPFQHLICSERAQLGLFCACVPSTSISGGTLGASLPSAPSLTRCSTQSSARSACWVSADTTHATQWASLVAAQLRVLLKALLYLPPSLFYSFHLLWKEASPDPSSKSSSPASAASFSQMQQDLFRQTPANIPDAQCLQQCLCVAILWDFFFHPLDIQIRVNICTTLTIYA